MEYHHIHETTSPALPTSFKYVPSNPCVIEHLQRRTSPLQLWGYHSALAYLLHVINAKTEGHLYIQGWSTILLFNVIIQNLDNYDPDFYFKWRGENE